MPRSCRSPCRCTESWVGRSASVSAPSWSTTRGSDVVRWLAEQGVMLAACQSECGRTYALDAFTPVEDQP
jgi:hypothetical protein